YRQPCTFRRSRPLSGRPERSEGSPQSDAIGPKWVCSCDLPNRFAKVPRLAQPSLGMTEIEAARGEIEEIARLFGFVWQRGQSARSFARRSGQSLAMPPIGFVW